ncbi:hypothetical protein ES707_08440 [subsurface metagenome]
MVDMAELYTTAQTAVILNLSERRIYDLIEDGSLRVATARGQRHVTGAGIQKYISDMGATVTKRNLMHLCQERLTGEKTKRSTRNIAAQIAVEVINHALSNLTEIASKGLLKELAESGGAVKIAATVETSVLDETRTLKGETVSMPDWLKRFRIELKQFLITDESSIEQLTLAGVAHDKVSIIEDVVKPTEKATKAKKPKRSKGKK